MQWQFSLGFLTAADCPPPAMIYLAARAGYKYVSLRTIAMGLPGEQDYGLRNNQALFKETQQALLSTGIKLLDIENARIHDQADLKDYFAEMELAAELGAQAVLTNVWTSNKQRTIDLFSQLCEKGQQLGMKVNLEFVTWSNIRNIQEALTLLEQTNFNNSGMIIDTLHFHRSKCTLAELRRVPEHYLTALHLCDTCKQIPTRTDQLIHTGRAERLYVGEGAIDIASIVTEMPQLPIVLEIPHQQRASTIGTTEHTFRCRESAETYLTSNLLSAG